MIRWQHAVRFLRTANGWSFPLKRTCLLLLLSLLGCAGPSGLKQGVYQDAQVRYRVVSPGAAWKPVRLQTADLSWFQPTTGSTLLVNSNCKGVKDVPLHSLTQHLLIGMTEKKIRSQEIIPFSNREALETEAQSKVDGVPHRMKMLVFKKDGCVYDLVFTAHPNFYEEDLAAYARTKGSFTDHTRRRR